MPNSDKCSKKCYALCVPRVCHPDYSVEKLNVNPIATYRKCKKFHKVKQEPVTSNVVVTPIPVAPFY